MNHPLGAVHLLRIHIQTFILTAHAIATKIERHIGEACRPHGIFHLFPMLPENIELRRLDLDACESAVTAHAKLTMDVTAQGIK